MDEREAGQQKNNSSEHACFLGSREGSLLVVGDGSGVKVVPLTLGCWKAIYGMTPTGESWVLT